MRHIIRLAVMLFITMFAATSWATTKKNKFSGLYIGIDGGIDTWTLKNDTQLFANSTDTVPFINLNNDTGQIGGSGGVFAGWAYIENPWYMSLEVNIDLFSNKHASNMVLNLPDFTDAVFTIDISVDEKQKWGASLDFHGGYIFANAALLYFRIGYAVEKFDSNAKLTLTDTAEFSKFVDSFAKTTDMQAFRVGIGGEYAIQRNWRIRTEFFGDIYQNKQYFLSDIPEIQALTNGVTLGAKRNFLAYYIGVLYNF